MDIGTAVYIEPQLHSLLSIGLVAPHMTTTVNTCSSQKTKVITMEIANPNNHDIIIRPDTKLAIVHPLAKTVENTATLQTITGYKLTQIQLNNNKTVDTTQKINVHSEDLLKNQTHLSEEQKSVLKKLIDKYPAITGKDGIGKTTITEHEIPMGDALPQRASQYRQPDTFHQIIGNEVTNMLDQRVIERSTSPWNAPIILVKKPDGSWRFCVDYRKLNSVTKKDCYPIPRIDETLDKLGKASIFTTIDLKSGYWQVKLAEKDKEKTAFSTRSGHYQFTVMPFGLCNAPATFQRLMDLVLNEYRFQFCLVYLDDIIIYSHNFEDHMKHLECVFQQLNKAGLTLNVVKCSFAKGHLKFLGHLITKDGILPLKEKVQAIERCPIPQNVSETRSFLGLANYYRRFVPMFSNIAAPLNKLLSSDKRFEWTADCESAFQTLKDKLKSAPILRRPDYNLPFAIYTDASNIGIGGVLTQTVDNKEYVIAYCSRTLNRAEQNYSTTERECLAVVYSIKEFRPYIYGTPFTVTTDHQALMWLAKLDNTSPRLARWILALTEHDFKILYRPGKTHQNADALSWLPQSLKAHEELEKGDTDSPLTFSDLAGIQYKTQLSSKTINLIIRSPSCVVGTIRRSERIRRKTERLGNQIPSEFMFS